MLCVQQDSRNKNLISELKRGSFATQWCHAVNVFSRQWDVGWLDLVLRSIRLGVAHPALGHGVLTQRSHISRLLARVAVRQNP